jgi:hypothetical protein
LLLLPRHPLMRDSCLARIRISTPARRVLCPDHVRQEGKVDNEGTTPTTIEGASKGSLVAALTPVIAILASGITGVAARNLPGLQLDPAQVTAVTIATLTTVAGIALEWLQGWQRHEARVAEGSTDLGTGPDWIGAQVAKRQGRLATGGRDTGCVTVPNDQAAGSEPIPHVGVAGGPAAGAADCVRGGRGSSGPVALGGADHERWARRRDC